MAYRKVGPVIYQLLGTVIGHTLSMNLFLVVVVVEFVQALN